MWHPEFFREPNIVGPKREPQNPKPLVTNLCRHTLEYKPLTEGQWRKETMS